VDHQPLAFSALILDLGGVLIETPTRDAREDWEHRHGLEPGDLDRFYAEAIGPGWEGGRQEHELHARLCALCQVDMDALPDLLLALHADERVCPIWARALDEIQGRYALALLTNSGPATRSTLLARHRLDRWFSVAVISAEEQVSKPDARIYQRTCERLGLAPARCLFVDDRQANVDGAHRAGLAAIRFTSSRATIPKVLTMLASGP
jgi:HAD superfamily hydrolase (TIGR01509 family)